MSDPVAQLDGVQARMREHFFDHDSGLFVLDCTAGFGKSTTAEHIAAESLCVAERTGRPCPEEQLAVVSFARDDAAGIGPGIEAVLELFADDEQSTACTIDSATASRLTHRLRQSESIGTIDSVLRSVFDDIAGALGFDDMPTVGNEALLASLRRDCLAELRTEPGCAELFATLEAAYGDGDQPDVDALLESGRRAKRDRRLTDAAFRDRLTGTVDDVYPEGPPDTVADIRADISRFYDDAAAGQFAPSESAAVTVRRDTECHDRWRECVDAFASLVAAYERAYDRACRSRGVLSHGDVAYWIAEFFDTSHSLPDTLPDVDERVRERARRRHATQFQTLVVDEAQDVSVVQHDALAELVPDDARVLLAGDTDQCIYAWRNARPDLFTRAFATGRYFGRDWTVHKSERATRTYRMRPDITAAVDTLFADVFTDTQRGADGTAEADYRLVTPDRDPVAEPSVHVAAYRANGVPGSESWFDTGESEALATYLHSAIATDAFGGTDDCDTVTVLFSRRTNMDTLATALQERGLTVANASQRLFEAPLVGLVCAVVDWLVDPFDPDRTRTLLDHDACEFLRAAPPEASAVEQSAKAVFAAHDYRIEAAADGGSFTPPVSSFVRGLRELAARRARHASDPGTLVIDDIVETLELRTDPFGHVDDAERCLAIVDALVDRVGEWEGDDRYSISDLAAVCRQYRHNPADGPTVPVTGTADHDVVFRTIHNMKGDEASVVCLADLSNPVGAYGPHGDTFVAHGDTLALAPPTTLSRVQVYDGDAGYQRSASPLRWATNRWVDGQLAGAPSLRAVSAAHRADRWRLLYVALTRAQDHLVLSLPRERADGPQAPRNSWLGSLQQALELERAPSRGSYDCPVSRPDGDASLPIGVNDVPFDPPTVSTSAPPTPRAASQPAPVRTRRTPRFVSGSALAPLQTAFDRHWLPYLQGRALHTERPEPDPALALPFDAVGPDAVGTIAHDVLTAAISLDIDTEDLRACSGPLEQVLADSVADHAADAGPTERATVREFVGNTVCPQFAETATWARLRASTARFIEEPVDAVADVAGLRIEAHNHVDVVSVAPDGTWHVDELKIALTEAGETLRCRHERQVTLYLWALERQLPEDANPPVSGALTYLGTEYRTRQLTLSETDIREQLDRLRSR
ncbi:UvrD-helicase domain-containing protein [Haloarcula sediminis]|uniref:UvrD-helicase domain-containing protein n=1 Tax=Haloarcula sediminis TaxID=3111777 RepID=UPI002D78FD6F|nr:UvrD-helicase domain-containing protein [Haloarcula sp. CK38]